MNLPNELPPCPSCYGKLILQKTRVSEHLRCDKCDRHFGVQVSESRMTSPKPRWRASASPALGKHTDGTT